MTDLIVDIVDGIGRLTINRPEARNSVPASMYGAFKVALQGFEHDPSVRVVLITGAGPHFCAGGDVREFAATVDFTAQQRAAYMADMIDQANEYIQIMARMPQPVVVSARGMAIGAGLSMVAAADLAIVSETCKMIAGQIAVGGVPDACVSYNLVRLMGVRRAKQYAFFGDTIDAGTALESGLVNWVVPDAELEQRTEEIVARLAKGPRLALALTKRSMDVAHTATLADHCAQEPLDIAACVQEDDFARSVQAIVRRISA